MAHFSSGVMAHFSSGVDRGKRKVKRKSRSELIEMTRHNLHRVLKFMTACVFVAGPVIVEINTAQSAELSRTVLHCVAHVSDEHPTSYSTVLVTIRTVGHARVGATAHYKTTDTAKSGLASSAGVALIAFCQRSLSSPQPRP